LCSGFLACSREQHSKPPVGIGNGGELLLTGILISLRRLFAFLEGQNVQWRFFTSRVLDDAISPRLTQRISFRRTATNMPSSPVAENKRVLGSGIGEPFSTPDWKLQSWWEWEHATLAKSEKSLKRPILELSKHYGMDCFL